MKKSVFAIIVLVLLFAAGCNPSPEPEEQESDQPAAEQRSECETYSPGPQKILCEAMESEDINRCEEITGRFREECIIVLAEMNYDTSLVGKCDISMVENNRIICRALLLEDVDQCFIWEAGGGFSDSLAMRDCIDLTSRKMRDENLCDLFKTRAEAIEAVCGESTSDCEGLWINGAEDNAESCKSSVREAIESD